MVVFFFSGTILFPDSSEDELPDDDDYYDYSLEDSSYF